MTIAIIGAGAMGGSLAEGLLSLKAPPPSPGLSEDRDPGCKYDHYSNAVSVAISRRRYPHKDNGRNYIERYYQIEYNAFG